MAGFWVRFAAHIIDWVILTLVFVALERIAEASLNLRLELNPEAIAAGVLTALFLLLFYAVLFFAYFTYFHGAFGQTVGKMILKIKVVNLNENPIDYLTAFVRTLAYQASWSSLGLGFLWITWDRRRQGWHDKIAETKVIRLA